MASYDHPTGDPVYSLSARPGCLEASQDIEVLLFDIQEIGARTYTYASTLNYAMKAAAKYGKKVVVLDRPNPVGGVIVEGPVLDEGMETFVGVDNLPMAHGMTIGELARFYNREIGRTSRWSQWRLYRGRRSGKHRAPWIPHRHQRHYAAFATYGTRRRHRHLPGDLLDLRKNIDYEPLRPARIMNAADPGVTYVRSMNGLGRPPEHNRLPHVQPREIGSLRAGVREAA